ncbi:hypothetical protein KEJ48_05305 [Candidatus Bathyarchaeota archaeon]|nr:hypothetical protein [Candidatus Bathyarchaeota archaeon]MBS7617596.1 hypothetical protein [Candidatus Bathyarchaeota archaeon]
MIETMVTALTSKLKIGYMVTSTLAIILALHLLLSDSNLPYFVALLFLGLGVLVVVAVWYAIVRPLSRDMD